MKYPFVICFAVMGIVSNGQTGTITDTVRCRNNALYNYALYLPANYRTTSQWPVIFIFDPAARGTLEVRCFRKAAARYGYILICSNNAKNNLPADDLKDIINSMLEDTEARYTIDPNRIYTSGFSGGSRVAALLALENKNIAGIIGCGAGLPVKISNYAAPSFYYIGIVGDQDMNYLEMVDLLNQMNKLGIAGQLKIFEGAMNGRLLNYFRIYLLIHP